jgi:hypothetical protein
MGISAPPMLALPYTMLESHTFGSMHIGMPSSAQISPSHSSVWMLNSMVREAFVTSVTCAAPFVSFQISQVSTVPNSSSPRSARSCAPSTWSRIQRILVALKYASMRRPVFSRIISAWPCFSSSVQKSEVRRHCHTMALYTGRPVALSHTMVVSRWFVMPMPAISPASSPLRASTSIRTPYCEA